MAIALITSVLTTLAHYAVMVASPLLTGWDILANFISTTLQFLLYLIGGPKPLLSHTPGTDRTPCVLVTGTSAGLGREIALRLAKSGYVVFAGVRKKADGADLQKQFVREEEMAQDTLEGLDSNGGPSIARNLKGGAICPIILDVTDSGKITDSRAIVDQYLEIWQSSQLVGVVNVAGIIMLAPLEIADDQELQRQFDVNFFGVMSVTKAFLPLLRASRGRIINIGSAAGVVTAPTSGLYSASKAALMMATEALRMELRPFGIGVSAIAPGAIRSRAWDVGSNMLTAVKHGASASKGKAGVSSENIYLNQETIVKSSKYSALNEQSYHPLFSRLQILFNMAHQVTFPPKHVSQLVEHALVSRFPRSKYYAGFDSKLIATAQNFLPDAIVEYAVKLVMW
ncbi:hypothetical protein DFS34DRAFT_616898 [Phlyctochytrium arcticum]|nr:hypothetical protein DFS34DRAFT_616898 [Phlyctochytrium arcticum]